MVRVNDSLQIKRDYSYEYSFTSPKAPTRQEPLYIHTHSPCTIVIDVHNQGAAIVTAS